MDYYLSTLFYNKILQKFMSCLWNVSEKLFSVYLPVKSYFVMDIPTRSAVMKKVIKRKEKTLSL